MTIDQLLSFLQVAEMLATPGRKDDELEVEELASLLLRPAADEEARSAAPRALEALRSQVL